MIDQGRFIGEFGPHILHFQAKDVQIDRDGLYERGSMSSGIGWQIPRLPDWAVLDINQPRSSQRPAGIADAGFFDERWQLKK